MTDRNEYMRDWYAKNKRDRNAYMRKRYADNREMFKARASAYRGADARSEKLASQDGVCAICGSEDGPWHLDHDPSCCPAGLPYGRRCKECDRGVLCAKCNKGLGHFSDNPETLRKAAIYLEAWRDK